MERLAKELELAQKLGEASRLAYEEAVQVAAMALRYIADVPTTKEYDKPHVNQEGK